MWRRVRVDPSSLVVSRVEARLRALSRSRLGVAIIDLRVRARSLDIGIDWGEGCQAVEGSLPLDVLPLAPFTPAIKPSIEVLAGIEVDIEVPLHRLKPFMLHRIEFRHSDAADFRPRSVLECVVIQELASQKKTDRQHTPNDTIRSFVRSRSIEHVHTPRQVVHSKEDRCAGESCRRQESLDKLAEWS